jgi:hypothetical protein
MTESNRFNGKKTEGRKADGTFTAGNTGGPGRPPRATEMAYMRATMDGCSPADWQAIVAKAVEDAKAGDAKAREWLAIHLIGKVERQAPSPTIAAADELMGIDPVAKMAVRQLDVERLDAILRM